MIHGSKLGAFEETLDYQRFFMNTSNVMSNSKCARSWTEAQPAAVDFLQRRRGELEELLRRYGVPSSTAPRLVTEALLAVGSEAGGTPPQESRLLRAVEHVSARWAEDRERAELAMTPPADTASPPPADSFASILRSVARRLDRRRHRLLREQDAATDLLPHLLLATPEERSALASEPRFHSWAVVDSLLADARRDCPNQPAHALDLSRLALAIAAHLADDEYGPAALADLGARTHMGAANAHRVMRDFPAADDAFQQAERLLDQGTLDPRLRAEWLRLKSALRRNQGHPDEAGRLLDQALAIYRWVGDPHEQGRATLSKALLAEHDGDPEGALDLVRHALRLLSPNREPRLQLVALHSMASQYADLGRYAETARLLPRLQSLCDEHGGELDQLKMDWLAGVVAMAGGDAAGEQTLLAVRQSYLERGQSLDAAVVSLEIAALYLAQGRTAETRQVADETLGLLRDRLHGTEDFSREAMAALVAFQQAARLETASDALVRQTLDVLRRSRSAGGGSGAAVPGGASPS